ATNEVAINWNAPMAYLAGAIEALNAGKAPSFAVAGVARDGSSPASIEPSVTTRKLPTENQVRLRVIDQKVFIEKGGKRFDLKGMQIK
ncbi:MAG: glycoside hydrolase, partial [Fibrobacter sp.]|nr:glycoside hydrolase [Fibrobacter sp.]